MKITKNGYVKKGKPRVTDSVCKHPGCIKQLLDYEKLAGEYCFKHQRNLLNNGTNNNRLHQ